MSKTNYKRLGDYIREVDVRNRDLKVTKLLGVSISKEFMTSIANTIERKDYFFIYGCLFSESNAFTSKLLMTELCLIIRPLLHQKS